MRKAFLMIFFIGQVYAQQVGSLVGGYVFGTATSRSFGRYADMINANPEVTDKLGNFWFAHGYEVGIEFPNVATVLPATFHYRRLTSHTSYTSNSTGKVNYDLLLNQYFITLLIGGFVDGSNLAVFFNMPMSYTSAKITHTIENLPSFKREYRGAYPTIGLGFSLYATTGRRIGLYFKMAFMGHMIPIKELKTELFDRKFFSDPNAGDIEDYYMNYTYKGKNDRVRADFRGITAEIGIVFILFEG